jgi:isocitrate dehydrogenase (NAD+)
MDAAVRAVEATGAIVSWEPMDAGAGAIPKHGSPLPEATLASIARIAFASGAMATPIGGGYRSVNVALEFDLTPTCVRRAAFSVS